MISVELGEGLDIVRGIKVEMSQDVLERPSIVERCRSFRVRELRKTKGGAGKGCER